MDVLFKVQTETDKWVKCNIVNVSVPYTALHTLTQYSYIVSATLFSLFLSWPVCIFKSIVSLSQAIIRQEEA